MKKQWIIGGITLVIFISLSFYSIKIAEDRNGKKTEFEYVCHVDSGNHFCELSSGFFDLKRVGSDKHPVYDAEQTDGGIVFRDIAYDGELPTEVNCWMDFIIDGEAVSCGLLFRRTEECSDKDWKGEIFLDIKKRGDIYEVSPRVTNCKSVELRDYLNNSAGYGYYFNVYQ